MPRGRSGSRVPAAAVLALLTLAAGVVIGGCAGKTAKHVSATSAYSTTIRTTPAPLDRPLTQAHYLSLAEQGVAEISKWWDPKLHWYLATLNDRQKRPLAQIWDSVSTFELLDEVAMARPTSRNRVAVEEFADYYQHFWDPNLKPAPGYAPYAGDRGAHQQTWYDDNGWLGVAFLDADRATATSRYLPDAERAFAFIAAGSWDAHGGGMWWSTSHPWRSGEALAVDSELAARLYQVTHNATYLRSAEKWIAWANRHLRQPNGVYIKTSSVPYGSETYTGSGPASSVGNVSLAGHLPPGCKSLKTCHIAKACPGGRCRLTFRGAHGNVTSQPGSAAQSSKPTMVAMPHDGEGAMLTAMVTLCEATGHHAWCREAERFAAAQLKWLEPFDDGPPYDAILLRGFISLYALDHNARWYRFVSSMAAVVIDNARTAPGIYLDAWDGGSRVPGAPVDALRTDASSLSVFADLATVAAPSHLTASR